MAARIWFDSNTPVEAAERAILNRAARILEDDGVRIDRSVLSHIRTAYRPDMSAGDLAEVCDPRS